MSVVPISACDDCHHHESMLSNKKVMLAMQILEKISFVALAAFAGYTSPRLFLSFVGGGTVLSIYLHWDAKSPCKNPHSEDKHTHVHDEGDGGGCSQGFLEKLTGVRLPAPLGLAANFAITACHIDHHDSIFVPLVGLNTGMWLGKQIGEYLPLGYRRISAWCCSSKLSQV